MSDDGEVRLRLQQLGLELRQEQHRRVQAAHERRANAITRSQAARRELQAALRPGPERPGTLAEWAIAIAQLAGLRLAEQPPPRVDHDVARQAVLEAIGEQLDGAELELASMLFELDLDELAFEAHLHYIRSGT